MYYVATRSVSPIIDGKKTTAWEESGFPARFLSHSQNWKEQVGTRRRGSSTANGERSQARGLITLGFCNIAVLQTYNI